MQVSSGSTAILLFQLVHCFGLLQPLLYSVYFTMHVGIACLHLHAGIACLTSLACDWVPGYVTAYRVSVSAFPGL